MPNGMMPTNIHSRLFLIGNYTSININIYTFLILPNWFSVIAFENWRFLLFFHVVLLKT